MPPSPTPQKESHSKTQQKIQNTDICNQITTKLNDTKLLAKNTVQNFELSRPSPYFENYGFAADHSPAYPQQISFQDSWENCISGGNLEHILSLSKLSLKGEAKVRAGRGILYILYITGLGECLLEAEFKESSRIWLQAAQRIPPGF